MRLLFSFGRRARTAGSRREPEDPIRAELFSIECLELQGERLAIAQRVITVRGRGRSLVTRL